MLSPVLKATKLSTVHYCLYSSLTCVLSPCTIHLAVNCSMNCLLSHISFVNCPLCYLLFAVSSIPGLVTVSCTFHCLLLCPLSSVYSSLSTVLFTAPPFIPLPYVLFFIGCIIYWCMCCPLSVYTLLSPGLFTLL